MAQRLVDYISMSSFLDSILLKGFPGGPVVKNLPANAGDMGLIPGSERALGKEMATYSSILAWEIPWTEEPGGLQLMGTQNSQTLRISD